MTIEELLDTLVPLPLSRHGFGPIGLCGRDDLKSTQRCIERDHERYSHLAHLVPVIRRLRNALKRDEAANTVSDLRIFAVQGAIKNGLKA